MYPKYFGLREPSFSIAPDPHYLFLSEQHREALAHLLYGAGESGGFVLLTGEVGTGKTTVCRAFLEQLPDGVDVALILNPAMTANELLLNICDELRIAIPEGERSVKVLVDRLNRYLLAAHANGRRPVLMIDEAQNLRPKVMEQIRLLTNLETDKHKLLQIFLVGQPELRRMLERDSLRQINQRITARFHLRPLSPAETGDYIRHRVAVAGVDRPLFTGAAIRRIHQASAGVPRLINILCDRALLGACVTRASQVTPAIVAKAAREVRGDAIEPLVRRPAARPALAAAAALALVLAAGWLGYGAAVGDPGRAIADLIESHRAPGRDGPELVAKSRPTAPKPAGTAGDPAHADVSAPVPSPVALAVGPAEAGPAQAAVAAPPVGPLPEALPAGALGHPGQTPESAPIAQAEVKGPDPAAAAASPGPVVPAPVPPLATVQPAGPPAAESSAAVAAAPAQSASPAPLPMPAPVPPQAQAQAQQPQPAAAEPLPKVALASFAPEQAAETLERLSLPEGQALGVLLRRWGLGAPDLGRGDPCPRIAPLGLRCEREHGRLSHVRFFDRPVLLRLMDLSGQPRYAVLVGLDEVYGTLDLGWGSELVPIAGIESVWTGDYTVVWQLPPTGAALIGPGASGDSVRWLRRLLSEVPGSGVAYTESGRFDAMLSGAVRDFQSARGLAADGIAGPRTLIQLHNAAGVPGIPRLMPQTDEGAPRDAVASQAAP